MKQYFSAIISEKNKNPKEIIKVKEDVEDEDKPILILNGKKDRDKKNLNKLSKFPKKQKYYVVFKIYQVMLN